MSKRDSGPHRSARSLPKGGCLPGVPTRGSADSRNDRSLLAHRTVGSEHVVAQGAPPGELSTAPAPRNFPLGWSIGTPDMVFEMPEPFSVRRRERCRSSTSDWRPTRLETFRSSLLRLARAIGRSFTTFAFTSMITANARHVGTEGQELAGRLHAGRHSPPCFLRELPRRIPRGCELIFEVHYTPVGKLRFDRSSVGLIVSKQPPRHLAVTRGIACPSLEIPPREPDHVAQSAWIARRDVHLLSLTPHMHLRGKSFAFTAKYPDGRTETLLSVPAYDFNWQSVYRLAEPKPLPAGTVIRCEAHFDNSAANPANPDPDRTVLWGEQSWDEMMIGFIDYYEDEPISSGAKLSARRPGRGRNCQSLSL